MYMDLEWQSLRVEVKMGEESPAFTLPCVKKHGFCLEQLNQCH